MMPVMALVLSLLPLAGPQTYQELQENLPLSDQAQRQALIDFADDDRATIQDRVKAARAAANKSTSPDDKLDAQLRVVALQGTAQNRSGRRKALKKAEKLAKKLDSKKQRKKMLAALKAAKAGDKALKALSKAAKKRSKKDPAKLSAKEKKALKDLRAGIKAYTLLKDQSAVLRGRVVAADLLASTPSGTKGSRSELMALVEEEARRDDEATLRRALMVLSRMHEKNKRWKKAALTALAADRVVTVPIKQAAFDPVPAVHGRSKRSSRLCFDLWEKKSVNCAKLERDKWGAPSFHDFSKDKKLRRFSQDQARVVLSEYRVLLEQCVEQSDDLTEFDTEVQLSWEVTPDGRVSQYDTRPRHLKMGGTSSCFDDAFEKIRYPRFRGPPAQVEMSWDVDTKRR